VDEDNAPWESLTSDTEDPSARADTSPRSGAKGRSGVRKPGMSGSSLTPSERRRLLIVIGVVSGIGLLLLIVILWKFDFSRPAQTVQARPPLVVTKDGSQANSYPTIQQALLSASRGDHIVLLDRRHEEQVRVLGDRGVTAVTIEAAPGKEVTWTAPPGKGNDPLLTLYKAPFFHLKGDRLTLDGQGRAQDLIAVYDQCEGLQLENAHLRGFVRSGVAVANAEGSAQHPIRLSGLVFSLADGKDATDVGLLLSAKSNITPAQVDYLFVSATCRFGDLKRALKRADAKAQGKHVMLPHSLQ
jgi:hypothetical protein